MRVVLVFGSVLLCLAAGWGVYTLLGNALAFPRVSLETFDQPVSDDTTPVRFTVRPGQSAQAIGDELQARGLVRSSLAFKLMVESRGVQGQLSAGEYELSPSMKTSEIVDRLARGVARRGTVLVVPEGWRAHEIARRLHEDRLLPGSEFLDALQMSVPGASLVPAGQSMEGYLFPDTYEIGPSTTAVDLVRQMYLQFDRRFHAGMRRQASERGLTVHQVVTLASIIEREAQIPAERAVVSAVFHNRLQAGMPLQADPTVQFAVANLDLISAHRHGFWKRELSESDLEIDSPYNTYRVNGLPPGPICNPGLDALTAAISPAPVDYLYFVARGDGSHVFARTEPEHRANVERYR